MCIGIGIDASRAYREPQTGTERYSRELIAALTRAGGSERFRLYTDGSQPAAEALAAQSAGRVEQVPIHQRRLWTHIGLAREIAARAPRALFVPAHVLPLSAMGWRGRPWTVVTVHDLGFRHFPAAHPAKQRLYLDLTTAFTARFADAIVADSQATRHDLQRFYNASAHKIRVAYPGALQPGPATPQQIASAGLQFGVPPEARYVLHIGTLQPRKNLGVLVRALAASAGSPGGDWHLVLAGGEGWGGERPALVRAAAAAGVAHRLHLTGYIDDGLKAALLRGAAVYACPSLYEGFGFPVLEAQLAGVPVICSNTSALPEVAGDAAVQLDPAHADAWARAIDSLLGDDERRRALIARGAANAARFTWDACADAVLGALLGAQETRMGARHE